MEQLRLIDSGRFLTRWTIKYDDVHGFPQFISGTLIDGEGGASCTERYVGNIDVYDMLNKIAVTEHGEILNLIGPGNRMFVVPESKLNYLDNEDPDDYNGEDDF